MTPAAVLLACAVAVADWGPVRVDAEGVPLPPGVAARIGSSRFRYSGDLYDLRFSPDGKQLVGITARAVHVWDAATGLRIATHAGFRRITHLAIRPDGHIAVLAGLASGMHHIVVDRETGRFRQQRLLTNDYDDIAISPDGSRIARRYGGLVQVLDADTGKQIGDVRFSISDISPNHFAFSPDGRRIVMVFGNNWTEVRDVATGNMPFAGTAGDAESTVTEVAFSADGMSLLRLIHANDKPYRLESVDLTTEKATPLHTFENTGRSRGGIVPSLDGKSVFLAAQNEVARVDLVAKTPTRTHALPHPTIVNRATLSPDGTRLAVALSNFGIALYDAATLAKLPQSSDDIVARSELGKFVADGKRLAIFGPGYFQLFDLAKGSRVGAFHDPHFLIALHPNGEWFARTLFKNVEICDVATGRIRSSFAWKTDSAMPLGFDRTGRHVFGCNGRMFRMWDWAAEREVLSHDRSLGELLPLPDGTTALSMKLYDGDPECVELELIDLSTGQPRSGWPRQRFESGIVAADANSRKVLVRTGQFRFGLFDLDDGRLLWQQSSLRFGFESVVFSPDGRSIALRSRRSTQLYDASTGKLRHAMPSLESQRPLAFTPDGKFLAALGPTAPIYLWDVRGALKNHPTRLDAKSTEALWTDLLGNDAEAAYLALQRLAAAPATTLPFVRDRVRPAVAPDPVKLAAWLRDLDAPAFRDREAAMKELKNVADTIAGDLRAARAATPSPEVHERLAKLLASTYAETPESVRRSRIVELVEWCGTAEAKALLKTWGGGAPGALLTSSTTSALARLR